MPESENGYVEAAVKTDTGTTVTLNVLPMLQAPRRGPKDQTTYCTGKAGTKYWMAKETLLGDETKIPYKSSSDIQVSFSAKEVLLVTVCTKTF